MFRRRRFESVLTLFFATDIHGSEVCFRKFISAKRAYGADYLVLGGDLTGKMIVPLIEDRDGYSVDFAGQHLQVSPAERKEVELSIRNAGFYPVVLWADEVAQYEAPEEVDELFNSKMIERLHEWNRIALERGVDEGTILVAPGNDDPFEIDDVLRDLPVFRQIEGICVDLGHNGGQFPMVSTGYSNVTPWRTHRELDESALDARLRGLMEGRDPHRTIMNIHVPPFDSGLDMGADVDPSSTPNDVRQRKSLGAPLTAPVGSTAVRRVIEDLQPMVSLHGHIHESRGTTKIGRTVCVNPGSDYGEGVLRGALVRVTSEGAVHCQLTSG